MPIYFHTEDIPFKLQNQAEIKKWINLCIRESEKESGTINYIFCLDAYLLEINKKHLGHDYYTDIITFDNSEKAEIIDADIFVSIERVKENAKNFGVAINMELHRVLIHGVLHLLGWNDKSPKEAQLMREKEDKCLNILALD
ncbi:MAG: rRNA maturation RNase YbeY [Chitinophagales bacterium]